jgi:outer membrane protein TolC
MTVKVFLSVAGLVIAARASALQPLDEFLRGARTSSADTAEARAAHRQARAEADAALGRALPRLSLRGTYTRNEFATVLSVPDGDGGTREVILTPRDQRDGTATLEVPLVDLSSFARIGAARTGAKASALQEASTGLRVESLASQDYFQLVANFALVATSRRAPSPSSTSIAPGPRWSATSSSSRARTSRSRSSRERSSR